MDEEEGQRRQPQARHEGALAAELEPVGLGQPQGLGGEPQGQGGGAAAGPEEEGRARQVQGQQGQVPEEVLAGADLVEGHEGERLRQQGAGQGALGRGEGDEHAGEEELREEGEGGDGRPGGAGRGEVELGVVRAEVVAVVDARDVVEVGVLQEGEAVAGKEGR